jgi:hypothetical protein
MLLATIGTDGHFDSLIHEAGETRIVETFHSFIDEVKVDIDALAKSCFSEPKNCLDALMRWGCG